MRYDPPTRSHQIIRYYSGSDATWDIVNSAWNLFLADPNVKVEHEMGNLGEITEGVVKCSIYRQRTWEALHLFWLEIVECGGGGVGDDVE